MPRGSIRTGSQFPTHAVLTGTWWKLDRVRNFWKVGGGEEGWGSVSQSRLSSKDPNSREPLMPGRAWVTGSQSAVL